MRKTLLAVLALLSAGNAVAQQTPATYCASLPPASCEILNIEPVGPFSSSWGGVGIGQVKYCKASQMRAAPVKYLDNSDFCSGCTGRDRYTGIFLVISGVKHIYGYKSETGTSSLNSSDTVTFDIGQYCQRLP